VKNNIKNNTDVLIVDVYIIQQKSIVATIVKLKILYVIVMAVEESLILKTLVIFRRNNNEKMGYY
jgi:hypothetical protein